MDLNVSEKGQAPSLEVSTPLTSTPRNNGGWKTVVRRALKSGRLEYDGHEPIPEHERTNTNFLDVGTLWFCMNANILPITFGMLGTSVYGLSLRDSSLIIIFFNLLTASVVAFLSTLGPKTGMRQMIQARYSFGRYLICVPVVLNLATLTGFCIIMAVIGGQCLSAVSSGKLSPSVGIVIVALMAMVISVFGFHTLHIFERYAWIPTIIAIAIAAGAGSDKLSEQVVPESSATAPQVMSFAMIVSSYMLPWGCLSSDFSTYMSPKAPSWRIFTYSYIGLILPTILLMTLGAAIGGAVSNVPEWEELYNETLVGGALAGMLLPLHGFGRFIVVILSFSLLGNLAATSYAITLNFQQLAAPFSRISRYIYAVLLTAIIIPISIPAAKHFLVSLENFIALIGYWSAAFLAVVIIEHFVFRKGDCSQYDPEIWNDGARLPLGAAAMSACVLSFALVIPSMAQVWWVGPIAEKTGDIGLEVAFFLTCLLYVPFRAVEKKYYR
ncbi:Purine-cytosine permease fcyB [Ceratocystis platani]|uniref:Purine-cytosine permease fcyB n=1 Tax=Ceratocystis fimbriata f. sp. platani TaxID=88771 RepID=A0A0F8BM75_CERFI|nr:Purine-cytosine permease fcyB [Ceratocystis platani]